MTENKEKMSGRRKWERVVYVVLVVGLAVYGVLKDSESAARLLEAVAQAFSVLFQNW